MRMENILKVAILGILTVTIVMSMILATNTVLWPSSVTSIIGTVLPIVIAVAIILVILSFALGGGKKGL